MLLGLTGGTAEDESATFRGKVGTAGRQAGRRCWQRRVCTMDGWEEIRLPSLNVVKVKMKMKFSNGE